MTRLCTEKFESWSSWKQHLSINLAQWVPHAVNQNFPGSENMLMACEWICHLNKYLLRLEHLRNNMKTSKRFHAEKLEMTSLCISIIQRWQKHHIIFLFLKQFRRSSLCRSSLLTPLRTMENLWPSHAGPTAHLNLMLPGSGMTNLSPSLQNQCIGMDCFQLYRNKTNNIPYRQGNFCVFNV